MSAETRNRNGDTPICVGDSYAVSALAGWSWKGWTLLRGLVSEGSALPEAGLVQEGCNPYPGAVEKCASPEGRSDTFTIAPNLAGARFGAMPGRAIFALRTVTSVTTS